MFVGNNYAYHAYNYNTGASAGSYDPAKPVNNSRNNTGLQSLPPAQPAFIWYPYANSTEFPQVGSGGVMRWQALLIIPIYSRIAPAFPAITIIRCSFMIGYGVDKNGDVKTQWGF
ncbi:hypothetical protein [Paraflavitalea speifideaquila]|uniref:hypothetical protein n=1 Tax=Paraflavitalea speifideaquila TaxID=3076558 RepID=UPI0028E9AE1A|nr:hypothetical protein [Paraflavitalea speifideiaquila]